MQTPKSEWPTQEEVDAARYYKQRYGNINEQEINPPAENEDVKYKQRGTKLNFMPEENLREFERTGKATGVKKKESKEFSDALYAAQLAANADPISYLGKDISRLNINDPPDDYTNAGYYSPKTDQIWWSGGKNQRTIPMHEYTHRGIAQLLNEHPNILEYDKNITVDGRNKHWDEEEYLVRRMILDRFGPIELRGGRKIEDHPDPAFRAAFKKDESADRHIQDMRRKAGELVARKLIDQQGAIR
jgi:hypothetical protein